MRAAVTLSGPEWLHLGVGVASVCFGTVSSFCIGRASDVCIGKQTLIWRDSPPDAAQDDAWCLSSSLEIDTRSGALALDNRVLGRVYSLGGQALQAHAV